MVTLMLMDFSADPVNHPPKIVAMKKIPNGNESEYLKGGFIILVPSLLSGKIGGKMVRPNSPNECFIKIHPNDRINLYGYSDALKKLGWVFAAGR